MTKILNIQVSGDSATLLLYGDIGSERADSARVVSELLALEAQCRKIDVRINSQGGDVFSGIAIYNALRKTRLDVTIHVDGVAASMAAIIALCGKPLYMSPYAKLMLHCVSGGVYGGAAQMRQTATLIEDLQDSLAQMIAGRCGLTADEVGKRYFDGSDHWLSAKEALGMKLIDGIYTMEGDDVPAPNQDIYQYFNNRLRPEAQHNENMALIDSIQALPSFTGKADESAILERIKELDNKAVKADALEQANASLKARIDELEKKEIDNILAQAVADGKITQEQVPGFTRLIAADKAATLELLGSMKPQKPTPRATDYINPGQQGASLEAKSWDELDRAGQLAELKNANPTLFASKYETKFGVAYKA